MDIFLKVVAALILFAVRLAVRLVVGTLVAFLSPLLFIILLLAGQDTDHIYGCYKMWMMTGEWTDERNGD